MNSCPLTLLQSGSVHSPSIWLYLIGLVKLLSYITRLWFILSRKMNMEFFTLQLGSDIGASQILFFELARVGIETGALYQILFLASYVLPCYHFLITILSNRSTVKISNINYDWWLRPKIQMCKTVHNGIKVQQVISCLWHMDQAQCQLLTQFNSAVPRFNKHCRKYVLNLTFKFEYGIIAIRLDWRFSPVWTVFSNKFSW